MEEATTLLDSLSGPQELISLIQQVVIGNHSALADFYDATSQAVYSLAVRIVGDRAIAEDVVVEVYAQVWAQAKTYEPRRGTPLAWLLAITRSRALDFLRSRRRFATEEPIEAADQLQSLAPNPEDNTVAVERYRVVRGAVDSLGAEQREVIELAYFSDLSHSEIAARLGYPLGTVKTRIRLGMLRLRELLTPFAFPPLETSLHYGAS